MRGTILSIQVGKPQQLGQEEAVDSHDRPWVTAFFKQPVDGPVWVSRLNIRGDRQADLSNHGGLDKAVLAYSAEHYAAWRVELDIPELVGGAFGENLTIGGLTEGDVAIGDTWRAGDVLFQVSQPRQPCWKLARRWRMGDLPKRVIQSGRSGWYLRVLEEGTITPGDALELVDRPHAEWTLTRANRAFYSKDAAEERAALTRLAELSAAWQFELMD